MATPQSNKFKVTTYIDADLLKRMQQEAEDTDSSEARIIRVALREYFRVEE